MVKNFNELLIKAKEQRRMVLAVAAAQDEDVLLAVTEAKEIGLVEPILVGDEPQIKEILKKMNMESSEYKIIHVTDPIEAARVSVKLIRDGEADFLMKGLLQTADIMRAVIDKETGLRTESLISHVMLYEVPTYDKLLYLTDGGMNVAPTLEQKVQIIENALLVSKALGLDKTYVACLAGAETVNPKISATVDGKALEEMREKWSQLNAVVAGPMALDLAISPEACKHKSYTGECGGQADILLVPYYEVGNALGKAMTYFCNGKSAGIIMGAKAPIVLVSRADSAQVKLLSIALGSVIAGNK